MSEQSHPPREITARELQQMARRIERMAIQRRKLLAKVVELDAAIRETKRLFRQLVEALGLNDGMDGIGTRGEDLP